MFLLSHVGCDIMLRKLNIQKHRLFFLFLPLFICKFLIVRYFLFKEFQPLETLAFELVYIVFFLSLFELIKRERVKWITYLVFNIIVTGLLLGLVLYFKYSGQIVSIIMLSQLNQVGTVKDSVFKLLHPIYAVLLIDLFVIFITRAIRKYKVVQNHFHVNRLVLIPVAILCFSVISYFIIVEKDKLIVNAAYSAEKTGIFTYEIVCVMQMFQDPPTLSKKEIDSLQSTIFSIKDINPQLESSRNHFAELEGRNIIYIQLEAFQNLLIHQSVNDQEITPFLNKLVEDSLYFPNIYQQIAAGSTSDAEFLANTSLYPNTPGATTKVLSDRDIPSFPKLLREQGYTSITLHANDVDFWNRDNLYPALGFDYYYDIDFFGKQQIIGIGPSDRVLFEKAIPELKQLEEANKPFYAQFITLTSHHPFVLPEVLNDFELPKEMDDHIIGDYIQVAHYVDKQLQYFFEQLEENDLLDNSVIVLYGDHQGLQQKNFTEEDLAIMKSVLGYDYTIMDQLNIPLIIHASESSLKGQVDVVGGQIDILPTVSNLIGLSLDNYIYFGQDLLNDEDNLLAIRYYLPHGSFFNQEIASVVYTNYKDSTLYDLHANKQIPYTNQYAEDYKKIMKLLDLNDQYLNSLPVRDENKVITASGK
jgi:lipoteichoic acid synthase